MLKKFLGRKNSNKGSEKLEIEKTNQENESIIEDDFEEELSFEKFLKENNLNDKYLYVKEYAQNNSTIKELENYFNYCKNLKAKKKKFVIAFDSLSEEGNFVERYCDEIIKIISLRLFFEDMSNEYSSYTANINSIIKSNRQTADNQLIDSFLYINDLKSLLSCSSEELNNFKDYFELIPSKSIIIFRANEKSLLDDLFLILRVTPDFSFQFNKEISFEEFKNRLLKQFSGSKTFEDNWERYLQVFLERSRQTRDLSLFLQIMKRLEKEYQMSGKEDNIIENKYFGVKVFGIDAEMNELKAIKKLNNLIGMEEVKEKVNQLIAYLDFNEKLKQKTGKSYPTNLHMCFTGSPGTGKTTIARIIAEIFYELGYIEKNNLVEVDKKDLVSQYVGHTSIKTDEIIKKAMGGVLFIDEAYSIVDNNWGKDAIATLIKAMEDYKTKLVVIFAGYEKEMDEFIKSNPGIKSRIGHRISFADYSVEELVMIYNNKLKEYSISSDNETIVTLRNVIETYKKEEDFGNGRFIDNLIQDILFKHAVNLQVQNNEEDILVIKKEDIPEKYKVLSIVQKVS